MTFALDQILGLEQAPDLEVRVMSVTQETEARSDARVTQSRACREATVLLDKAPGGIARRAAEVGFVLRHPVWFIRNWSDPQVRSGYLAFLASRLPSPVLADEIIAHFGNAGVLADRLRDAGRLTGRLNVFFGGYDLSRRSVWERFRRDYVRLACAGARLLPVCEFFRRRLLEEGCPPESVIVHRFAVDLTRFAFRRPRPVSDPPRLFSVARLVEKKGLDTALLALARLRDRGVTLRYRIAGEGPEREKLQALSRRLGLERQVEFLGAVPNEVVARELAAADVFTLPSQTAADGDMEGIPVSLMEAMATGVPVVSTYHSGIPELIEDGVSGFLVPERDAEALADRLLRCLEASDDEREALRRAARKRVEEQFDLKMWNARLLALVRGEVS